MAFRKCSFHLLLSSFLLCLHAAIGSTEGPHELPQDWLNHGGDLLNRRFASKEYKISPETAPSLRLKWRFYTGNDVTATPSIFKGILYFPSWDGNIYALKEVDGSLVWKQNLGEITGLNGTGVVPNVNWTVSRSTPTIIHDADLLIIGIYGPAIVIALRRTTGQLLWKTHLDHHPVSLITMSGTYYSGGFYVGVSSLEEGTSPEQCCTFRGSFARLDVKTGHILWQTYMLPDNHGKFGDYAGAAIWGSSPSIDPYRNHVYIATGNLYSAPNRILQCQQTQNNQTVPTNQDHCVEPENHSNSILALDLRFGNIIWYRQLGGYDVWVAACLNALATSTSCPPQGANPDSDFGEAPMMLTIIHVNGTIEDIVVAAQKSGFAWALDRDNGNLVWSTEAGPGGVVGGGIWGAATDEVRVYTNIANSNAKNFNLVPSNKTTRGGGWVAIDASNGKVVWSIANPDSITNGPVSVANGVVFVGSSEAHGFVYAINAKSGKILWSYRTGATVYGGMSINNGCIYVGHGYHVGVGSSLNMTSGNSLFAFCV